MAKRFTATEKWCDPWFRSLSPLHKLGWLYLLDACDLAGVVDLDSGLANFQIGDTLDWDGLIEAADGRIARIDGSKLWLTKFVEFQYGVLTVENRLYGPVRKILDKYSLSEGASKGHRRGLCAPKDKNKDKDKDRKGDARGKPKVGVDDVPLPDGFDTPAVRQSVADWLAYKTTRGEGYQDGGYFGRKIKEFVAGGPQSFIDAVNSSIGSNYAGLFPVKGNNGNSTGSSRVGPGQRYRGPVD